MAAARSVFEEEPATGELEQKVYTLQHAYDLLAAKYQRCEILLARERNSFGGRVGDILHKIGRLIKNRDNRNDR
jgi:hypothetical protein